MDWAVCSGMGGRSTQFKCEGEMYSQFSCAGQIAESISPLHFGLPVCLEMFCDDWPEGRFGSTCASLGEPGSEHPADHMRVLGTRLGRVPRLLVCIAL